jgi:predicted nucleic acid-binding protein
MPWAEVDVLLVAVRANCLVEPLSEATHDLGRQIAERYRLSVYDAMIVAAAVLAGVRVLYTEDLQDGLRVNDRLAIRNPFRKRSR